MLPSRGYVNVLAAYVCDEKGNATEAGTHVALELPECRLTKRIDGDVMRGYIRGLEYRVTQLSAIPAETPGGAPVVGLVFDECTGDVCPALDGWHLDGMGTFAGIDMNYGWFEPNVAAINAFRAMPGFFHQDPLPKKLPLVLWLHGAGEGQEPYRTVCGNKVTAISGPDIQGKLGGAAYVLAPSSPTFWMDPDGKGELVDDNQMRAVRYIREHYAEDISIAGLAEMENYNPSYFAALFKQEVGYIPSDYIRMVRMEKAKEILQTTRYRIIDVAMQVGYTNASSFTRMFRETTGMTPNQFRRLQKGQGTKQ